MGTFSTYRPESRLSSSVAGFVAGRVDVGSKFQGNVQARIRLALEDMAEGNKRGNPIQVKNASKRFGLLQAVLNGAQLDKNDMVFCGLVVEE